MRENIQNSQYNSPPIQNSPFTGYCGENNPHFNGEQRSNYTQPHVTNSPVVNLSDDGDSFHHNEVNNEILLTPKPEVVQKKKTNTAYTDLEDEALIAAYMSISTDACTGTNQRKDKFWKRVKVKYDAARAARPGPTPTKERTIGMLTNRWGRIAAGVMKWVGHYEQASRRNLSGTREEDVIDEAKILHGQGVATYEIQWRKLRNYPRWRDVCVASMRDRVEDPPTPTTASDSSGKRKAVHVDDNSTPPSEDSTSRVRPMGIKAAKKNKGKSQVTDFDISELAAKFQEGNEIMINKHKSSESMRAKFIEQQDLMYALNLKRIDLEEKRMKMQMWENLTQRSNLTAAEEETKMKLFAQLNNF